MLQLCPKITLEVAVITDRFLKKTGLVSVTTEEVNVDESILGRIFAFGTVLVHGTGAEKIGINMVSDPVRLRREIQSARTQLKSKGE